jgi:predicted membrane-bound dolichyl-phosphate-mannose-protein mannosyltransferase
LHYSSQVLKPFSFVALFSEQHSFTMHYTDIYSAVKPLYYVSVFFGLAPVSWRSEKKRGYIHAGLGVIKLFWTASLNFGDVSSHVSQSVFVASE